MEVMEVNLPCDSELKTERFVFMLEKSTLEAIDEWSFEKRVRTRAEVIRQLIQLGLEASKEQTKEANATA
jgi:metal-responsive CopG/Arc/MetJ family transcriptional regulator